MVLKLGHFGKSIRNTRENFEMWCWRRMEGIIWTDRVRNNEVLRRVKEERNVLRTIKRRKANWIGHILRRNCLLKHVTEGKLERRIEVSGRRGRRRKQLLDDLKERRKYWKLKEEALDRPPAENSLRKRLLTCSKADYRMNDSFYSPAVTHLVLPVFRLTCLLC
jgi:hypothetical protein